jgi:hypothetical protein
MGQRLDTDTYIICSSIRVLFTMQLKRPLQRRKHRWKDNPEMQFREIRSEDEDSSQLIQDAVQFCVYSNEPSISI